MGGGACPWRQLRSGHRFDQSPVRTPADELEAIHLSRARAGKRKDAVNRSIHRDSCRVYFRARVVVNPCDPTAPPDTIAERAKPARLLAKGRELVLPMHRDGPFGELLGGGTGQGVVGRVDFDQAA